MSNKARAGERIDALTRHNRPIRWDGDILSRAFAPRQNSHDAPPLTISEEPAVCLIVNMSWVSHVIGALETLNQPDAWTGDDEEKYRAQQEIQRLIEMLMTGDACMVDPCCPETNELLTEIRDINLEIVTNLTTIINQNTTIIDNDTTIINQNENAEYNEYVNQYNSFVTNNSNTLNFNSMLYDGNPQSIYSEAGEDFNTTGDGRLCAAIEAYINAQVYTHVQQAVAAEFVAGAVSGVVGVLATAAGLATGGLSIALGIALNTAIFLGVSTWRSILEDEEAQRKVRCCMYDALKDQEFSYATFQTSVDSCDFEEGSNEARLAEQIAHDNFYYQENWTAFIRAMAQGTATSDQNCVCNCDDDVVLEDFDGTGCIITPMGNCIYKFYQSTPSDEDGIFYEKSFRDILGRCLLVENTGDPTMPTEAVGYFTTVTNCEDVEGSFPGGFDGGTLKQVHWWNGYTPTTYYKITLAPEE